MDDPSTPPQSRTRKLPGWLSHELLVTVVLSITAILTAWSAFQASKWGGSMSIAFSQASSARIQASTESSRADSWLIVDVGVFSNWVEATAREDQELAGFYEQRFTPHLAVAHEAWVATRPLRNPDAPKSPFAMEEYVPPGQREAAAASARADAKFQQALDDNQRGDNYTLLTVLFASVLFFAAMSGRFVSAHARWGMLGLGIALFTVGAVLLASFPKLV